MFICLDCCDASDEYMTGNCSDVCYAMGEVARQEAKQRAELVRQGNEIRQQLIAKGKQIKQEKIVSYTVFLLFCFLWSIFVVTITMQIVKLANINNGQLSTLNLLFGFKKQSRL